MGSPIRLIRHKSFHPDNSVPERNPRSPRREYRVVLRIDTLYLTERL
jgi:hypothetical protein